ncbi:uncharacterized protein LOC105917108 isoform X2 [Fundulus heteroclitus]|uniref:uncharacterized protein LOC105917108 isoform X2 n=1 Tax=Fundulus heteroclitus TaxID=8078 RepID=UPI00165A2ACC|nr:uncharacterized protein LOC105917108 isoform X2 [Fundulus heteroclitus]
MPEIQRQTEGDLSSKVQSNSLKTSQAKQDEESDADSARLQVCCVSGTMDESKPQRTDVTCADGADGADGAEGGASTAALQSEDLNCGSVKLCEASATPTVPERDPSARPAAGPSVVHAAEGTRTADPEDPFGSGCSGYVSDSQLNAITLIEEREEEEPDPSGHLEDATDLVCGLIRELSSLNRRVMVAHRELENMRRKPSRSSVR